MMAPRTLARLTVGANARLYIETHVREDAIRLFGFTGEEERAWFAHLQTIPGVGAKVALGILDAMPPEVLVDAIALQDKAAFARANGVGPKLAARLAQELAAKQGPKGFISLGNGAPLVACTPGPVETPAEAMYSTSSLSATAASRAGRASNGMTSLVSTWHPSYPSGSARGRSARKRKVNEVRWGSPSAARS